MNKILIFVTSLFLSLIVSLEAIGEIVDFDEHWQKREEESVKAFNEAYNPQPYNVTNHFNLQVHMSMKNLKKSRRSLMNLKKEERNTGPCTITNPIDGCWRCKGNWAQNRKRLADCCIGFGRGTTGGKAGEFYEVTDPSDDDLLNPKPGTLRYAVIQEKPLWITFARPMNIRLTQEMMVTSDKTIDGRGVQVHITGGAGITLQFVKNVIIHGIYIHDIHPGEGGIIRDSTSHFGKRTRSDGDAISIFQASNIWIDHCSLARGTDGLIDIIQGSTAITVSNNHMTDHNEVFLFGATNDYTEDKKMQVTVAFNHFGKGLVQRMPRCRFGFFHVVNNDYTHWQMYAIGGNQAPTIISQGNRFIAPPNNDRVKEVTKREAPESVWKSWIWKSENDFFRNGAYFRQSGADVYTIDPKNKGGMIQSRPGTEAEIITFFAGPRKCVPGEPC